MQDKKWIKEFDEKWRADGEFEDLEATEHSQDYVVMDSDKVKAFISKWLQQEREEFATWYYDNFDDGLEGDYHALSKQEFIRLVLDKFKERKQT